MQCIMHALDIVVGPRGSVDNPDLLHILHPYTKIKSIHKIDLSRSWLKNILVGIFVIIVPFQPKYTENLEPN